MYTYCIYIYIYKWVWAKQLMTFRVPQKINEITVLLCMLLHHYRVYMCGIYWNQALKYSWSFARVYKYSIGMTVIIKLWLGMKERGSCMWFGPKKLGWLLIRQQRYGFRAHLWMIQWGPRILAQMGGETQWKAWRAGKRIRIPPKLMYFN